MCRLLVRLLVAIVLLAGVGSSLAAAEPRIALVIGNATYPGAPLRNPVNDARAMAAKLKSLGFEVMLVEDGGNRAMARAIVMFGERIKNGGVGLFYYSGHGMQVGGRNFLIPVDAQIQSEASVSSEAIDVDTVLEQMAAAGDRLNVVILDACRNNPFERRFRSLSGGLAQTDAPTGTIVAYATAPGRVASDGVGVNGLYTQELLRAMDQPGLKVEDVFKRVRARVTAATADDQVPWESSSLVGDFYFRDGAGVASAATTQAGPSAAESALWSSISTSKNPDDYKAYLRAYPAGVFASLAQTRIDAASATVAPAQTTSITPIMTNAAVVDRMRTYASGHNDEVKQALSKLLIDQHKLQSNQSSIKNVEYTFSEIEPGRFAMFAKFDSLPPTLGGTVLGTVTYRTAIGIKPEDNGFEMTGVIYFHRD